MADAEDVSSRAGQQPLERVCVAPRSVAEALAAGERRRRRVRVLPGAVGVEALALEVADPDVVQIGIDDRGGRRPPGSPSARRAVSLARGNSEVTQRSIAIPASCGSRCCRLARPERRQAAIQRGVAVHDAVDVEQRLAVTGQQAGAAPRPSAKIGETQLLVREPARSAGGCEHVRRAGERVCRGRDDQLLARPTRCRFRRVCAVTIPSLLRASSSSRVVASSNVISRDPSRSPLGSGPGRFKPGAAACRFRECERRQPARGVLAAPVGRPPAAQAAPPSDPPSSRTRCRAGQLDRGSRGAVGRRRASAVERRADGVRGPLAAGRTPRAGSEGDAVNGGLIAVSPAAEPRRP